MTALTLLLLLRALFAVEESPGSGSPAPGDVVIYLSPRQGGGPNTAALSEAVAIYTRDLRLTLQTISGDKVEPSPAAIERAAAAVRARRARLAFWCVPSPDGRTIVLHWLDGRGALHKEAVPLGEREGADVHRAVALKLRAILTPESSRSGTSPERIEGRDSDGARAAGPASATSQAANAAPPVAPAPPPPVKAASPPAVRPAPPPQPEVLPPPVAATEVPAVQAAAAPVVPPEIADWAVTLGYAAASFSGTSDLRHGFGAQLLHGVGPRGEAELFAGLEVGLPIDRAINRTSAPPVSGSVSVFDIPLRVGARLTPVRSTIILGFGAFAAVHLLAVGATATGGASDDRLGAAAGGGAEVLARIPTSLNFSWELRAWGEVLAPRTVFLLTETPAADTGRYAAGVALGVVLPSR